MINFDTFLFGLFITSVITALTTEAVKKILGELKVSYYSNTVSGIIALIISVSIGVGHAIINKTGFGPEVIDYISGHTYMSWLCAMVGYDKVIQAIQQMGTTKQK